MPRKRPRANPKPPQTALQLASEGAIPFKNLRDAQERTKATAAGKYEGPMTRGRPTPQGQSYKELGPQSKGEMAAHKMQTHVAQVESKFRGDPSVGSMEELVERRPRSQLPQGSKFVEGPKPPIQGGMDMPKSTQSYMDKATKLVTKFESVASEMGTSVSKELAPVKKIITSAAKKLPKGSLGVVGGITTIFDAADFAKDIETTKRYHTDFSGKKHERNL
jgi:hypothetical protein